MTAEMHAVGVFVWGTVMLLVGYWIGTKKAQASFYDSMKGCTIERRK